MIRAVLDANAIVSGFPSEAGTLFSIIDRWKAGQYRVVTSGPLIAEVERAWTKPYWQTRFTSERIKEAVGLLSTTVTLVK